MVWMVIPVTYQSVPVHLQSQMNCKQGVLDVGESLIIANEIYDVIVTLELPESETNFKLGNFDVEVSFNEQQVIRGIGILKYRSSIIRSVRSILLFLPIITGIWEESQIVKIGLQTEIQIENDIEKVQLRIFPKELQVYSTSLQLEVKLTGLRYMMHYYYYTSWILATTLLFGLESLAVLGLLQLRRIRKQQILSNHLKSEILEKINKREQAISKSNWILPKEKELTNKCLIPADFSSIIKEPTKNKPIYHRVLQRIGIRNNTIN